MARGERGNRILLVHHTALAGGAERSLVELAVALRGEGFDPVAALPHEGALSRMLYERGVPTRLVQMTRMKRTVNPFTIAMYLRSLARGSQQLADLAREEKASLIHSNATVAHLYGGEAAAKAALPCVWHVRDVMPLGALAGRMARTATRVVAISGFVREYLIAEGVPAQSISVIPNGIDLGAFPAEPGRDALRASARSELGIAPDSPVIATVSSVVPWKHPEDFVSVFARALAREKELGLKAPLRGLFMGADITGEHPDLERRIRERSMSACGEALILAGWRDDVPRLLAAADVYVSTSRREPFGRAVVEAMASGLPVVACRSGATPEIVVHGETGLLTGEEPAELAAAAIELLADGPRAREMGARAAARARESFNIARTAAGVAGMYRELAGRQGAAGARSE